MRSGFYKVSKLRNEDAVGTKEDGRHFTLRKSAAVQTVPEECGIMYLPEHISECMSVRRRCLPLMIF